MSSHFGDEQSVLESARRIDSEEMRSEYLADACGDDKEMLERIRKQLDSGSNNPMDDHDPTFLQTPPVSLVETDEYHESSQRLVDDSLSGVQAGVTIAGRYELRKPIAQGGMGSVWLARQSEPVKRQVAIKLIKAGMDSRQVLARFDAERQALAVMDHPNIAKVFDGGLTKQDRPFFAMEYVEGLPLTRYADQEKLSIPDRLELLVTICRAVQHAHQKGVIHRDLKPSNILVGTVDGRPTPKVIDFGLAKAMDESLTEQSLFTAHGAVLGTPLYMSPEQTNVGSQDIDTRTDIYSLGVILYELLTGSTPLEREQLKQASLEERVRLIREIDPPLPSTRVSGSDQAASIAGQRSIDPGQLKWKIAGDLDWIVMKALEKDRDRRYETVNGLAADIHRHLNDEPVTASPPSARYRIRKFVRRNRVAVVAVAMVAMALMVAVTGTSYGMIRANWALAEKDLALTETRQTIDNYVKTVQNAELLKEERFKPLMKELLNDALHYYENLIIEHEHSDESLEYLSSAMFYLAFITEERGETEKAIQAYKQTIRLEMEKMADQTPSIPSLTRLAKSHDNLGNIYESTGQLDLALATTLSAGEFFRKLCELNPLADETQMLLATHYSNLGLKYHALGRTSEALDAYRNAEVNLRPLVDQNPQQREFRVRLAAVLNNTAISLKVKGGTQAALAAFNEAFELRQELAEDNSASSRDLFCLARSIFNLGMWSFNQNNHEKSLDWFEKAREVQLVLVKENPNVAEYNFELSKSHYFIGRAYRFLNQLEDALRSQCQALTIQQKLLDENPEIVDYKTALATGYRNTGVLQQMTGQFDDALSSYQSAVALNSELAQAFPSEAMYQGDLAGNHYNVGNIYYELNKPVEALASFDKGIEFQRKFVEEHPENPDFLTDLGMSCVNAGHLQRSQKEPESASHYYDLAITVLEKAIDINPGAHTTRNPLRNAYLGRAMLNQDLGNFELAVADWDKAIEFDSGQMRKQLQGYRDATAFMATALGDWHHLLEQPADLLPELLSTRGLTLAAQLRFNEAAQAATELRKLQNVSETQLYNAACVFGLCAESIKSPEGKKLEGEQLAQRQQWIIAAMDALEASIDAGWSDIEHLANDPDLKVLHDLPEMKAIIKKSPVPK